jgi:hypothetical protein
VLQIKNVIFVVVANEKVVFVVVVKIIFLESFETSFHSIRQSELVF